MNTKQKAQTFATNKAVDYIATDPETNLPRQRDILGFAANHFHVLASVTAGNPKGQALGLLFGL